MEEKISKSDIKKLLDLRDLCIEEDLLDLQAYNSISRADKIQNAWDALTIIESLKETEYEN